jgi:hypothetical protein
MLNGEAKLPARQREWLEHIRACEASGQTMVAYAAEHKLEVRTLYGWKKRLVRKGVLPGRGSRASFQRVRVAGDGGGEWRIQLPNGIAVAFSGAVDGIALSTVLKAAAAVR